MSQASQLSSGKGRHDENFPVASVLIAPRHRPAIWAFYRFARTADDVADNPDVSAEHKLTLLSQMCATLDGRSDESPEALALRRVQKDLGVPAQHGLDLLEAFRRDVVKRRYASWNELIDYCRFSAAPVGRFVLEVHGESAALWPANDALCTALQIINHLQDCAKDYRDLDRVYIPEQELSAAATSVGALAEPAASPALKAVIGDLARRTQQLLEVSGPFSQRIADRRLAVEVAVIQRLAESLALALTRRDPLRDRVHHTKLELAGLSLPAALAAAMRRRPAKVFATSATL